MARSERVLIALATYNERDNLAPLVKNILHWLPEAEILITDDRSPDGTGEVADSLAAADRCVRVSHRPRKLGLGTAYLGAITHAREHGHDFLVTMDADFSHQPRYLPALLAGMDRHDVMIGSRYMRGGGVEDWPWPRLWMSRLTNWLVRLLLRLPGSDTSGGYRCYRVELLRKVHLDDFVSSGYSFQQEMLERCVQAGARVGETPIVFAQRRAGCSKAGLGEILGSLTALLRLGWRENTRGQTAPGLTTGTVRA